MPFLIWGYGATLGGSPGIAAGEWEQSHSQKFAWARLFRPMVQGHPLTPFTRLAFVGDITSSLTHWGTGGLRYINADYTVTASRLPDGEFVGLAAQSHYGAAGVATGAAYIPQALRIWKRRSSDDVSILTYLFFLGGQLIYLVYGIRIRQWPLIIGMAANITGSLAVIGSALRFRHA